MNYAENAYHVVTASGNDSTAVLDGFTISAGSACCDLDQNDHNGWGGGLHGINASPTLIDCTFSFNRGNRGGGAYLQDGVPTLVGCTFESNIAIGVNEYGGGLYCQGALTLTGCTFLENGAQYGGGLLQGGGAAMIAECEFNLNAADRGGAVYFSGPIAQVESTSFANNFAISFGGAIFSNLTELTLTECEFTSNSLDEFGYAGGAIYISGAPATIETSTFIGNGGPPHAGGGAISSNDPTTINACTFISNSAGSWVGGAIVIGADTCSRESSISSCQFIDNTALLGGAIAISANCTISDCTFEANLAPSILGGQGGAIFSSYGKTAPCVPTVIRCSFKDNKATANGGAVVNSGGLDLMEFHPVYQDCEFIGNEAASLGGAVYNSASSPILVNCTFATNGSGNRGGAIFSDPFCAYEVINCTFHANFAFTTGGAIEGGDMYGLSKIVSSIFRANTPDQMHEGVTNPVNVFYSNVQGGWPGIGLHNIDADPLFVDPVNLVFSLSPGSPCIDRADGLSFPADIETDLAGNPRFLDDLASLNLGNGLGVLAILDMGALEFQPAPGACEPDCAAPADRVVDVTDLNAVIDAWSATSGPVDVNGDAIVDVDDLLLVIENWGPCS